MNPPSLRCASCHPGVPLSLVAIIRLIFLGPSRRPPLLFRWWPTHSVSNILLIPTRPSHLQLPLRFLDTIADDTFCCFDLPNPQFLSILSRKYHLQQPPSHPLIHSLTYLFTHSLVVSQKSVRIGFLTAALNALES